MVPGWAAAINPPDRAAGVARPAVCCYSPGMSRARPRPFPPLPASLVLAAALLAALPTAARAQSSPPRRIVLAGRAVALVADALYVFPGARGRVVASAGTDQGLGNFLEVVDPALAARPPLDRQAGPEAIAALRPDLVLMKSSMEAALRRPLEAVGIPARSLSLETPQEWAAELAALGGWLGDPGRAGEVAAYFRDTAEAVRRQAAADGTRPAYLLLYVSAAGEAFNVPPAGWMQTAVARAAGGRPVWEGANPGSGWARVSFEQIAAWDPELIAVASYGTDSGAAAARLRADPRFRALAAARAGRLLAFPQDHYSWDQSGSRWLLGLVWLARQLHPQRFPPGAALAEARRFYRLLYGLDEPRFAAFILPKLKGDYAR